MPHVMWMGDHASLVTPAVGGGWKPIDGNRVRRDAVVCCISNGVGVVQPGAPGRLMRQVYLKLPDREVLLERYSSDEYHDRSVVEVSDDTASSLIDQQYLERYCENLMQEARRNVKALLEATDTCMVAVDGRVAATLSV